MRAPRDKLNIDIIFMNLNVLDDDNDAVRASAVFIYSRIFTRATRAPEMKKCKALEERKYNCGGATDQAVD